MTEFDLWESALARRDDVESRTVHGDAHGTGVYVSRTFFFRNWTRFYAEPVYHVFIGGRLIVSTTDYLEAYAVWSREAGLVQDFVARRARAETDIECGGEDVEIQGGC